MLLKDQRFYIEMGTRDKRLVRRFEPVSMEYEARKNKNILSQPIWKATTDT